LTRGPSARRERLLLSYGEGTVGLLRELHFLHLLHVVVISDGGWNWVLGWSQLGMKRLVCVSLTEASALEMDRVAAMLQGLDLEPSTWPVVAPGVDGATAWLTGTNKTGTFLGASEKEAKLEVLKIDWSRARAPWLGEAGSPISITAYEQMIILAGSGKPRTLTL
jgi:hypothetical protein